MIDSDEPRIAETARYWRLNSISALEIYRHAEREAQDPEHLEKIRADNAELAGHQARENAVKARYNRIKSRGVNL